MGPAHRSNWRETTLAILIAGLLTLAWSIAEWTRLSALILPDPDDILRLVQIRDWLDGQRFGDVTQYRLGGGLAMHWSRLPDLVPAALIRLLEPLLGRHGAEVAAVIAWPAMLFATTLALLGSCARRLSRGARGAGVIAVLLGAIAYPATGFFMPGRIDHHGLQLVLLLVAARAMLAPPSARAGLALGLAVAASLAIGLETAPLCAVVLAAVALRWTWAGRARDALLTGCGIGLAGGVAFAAIVLRPTVWPATLCDAFTPPIAWMAILAGGLLALVGAIGPQLRGPAVRIAALAIAGVGLAAATPFLAPACLTGPYGAVPPLLRALWLDHVAEAQPLLVMPFGVVLAYAGLMFAGVAVSAIRWWQGRGDAAWLGIQLGAVLLACIQLRVAPFGAALAVPVMAAWVAQLRRGARPLAVASGWAVSAGILYPLVAGFVPGQPVETPRAPCLTAANLDRLKASGPGMVAVPLDMGAYVIAASDRPVLAAPYHRNSAANLAHYRLFLGRPQVATAEARRWKLRAIAYCPGWVDDLDPSAIAAPGSIVALAKQGRTPDWASVDRTTGLVVLTPRP